MNFLFCVLISLISVGAQAGEASYYQCAIASDELQRLEVKQVATNNNGTVISTFKIDVTKY